MRYELPELLGEHRYDGTTQTGGSTHVGFARYQLPIFPIGPIGELRYDGTTETGGFTHVGAPFHFSDTRQARLVIEGTVEPGKARGDGIIRQAAEFDLALFVETSFPTVPFLWTTPAVGSFHFDEIHPWPFRPKMVPLPGPGGHPVNSFSVDVSLSLMVPTIWPSNIDRDSPFDYATDGIIIDVPIVVNITNAYVVFQGPLIVPEPSTGTIAIVVCLFLFGARFRRSSGGHSNSIPLTS
jgi:hypothetical protein